MQTATHEITAQRTPQIMLAPDLAEHIQAFSQALREQVEAGEYSANTAATYRKAAGRFVEWRAAQPAGDTADLLRAWKAYLLKSGVKPASVNTMLAGVRALGSWAVEAHRLPFNPVATVRGVKRRGANTQHARMPLTNDEVRRLLAAPDTTTAAGKRDAAILHLMLYTGLRGVSLHRADLDDLHTAGGKLVLQHQGKGRSGKDDRAYLVNPAVIDAVLDWKAARGDEAGPLFLSLSNHDKGKLQRLSLPAIRAMVTRYMRAAGIVGVGRTKTPHSLRHTAITAAVRAGVELQSVQIMAGHSSVETTMRYVGEADRLADPAEAHISYDTAERRG